MMSSSTSPAPETAVCSGSEVLSLCNQVSPRSYISLALCFPLDESSIQHAMQHLKHSLRDLASEQPLFAARLRLVGDARPGVAQLISSPNPDIPFEVMSLPACVSVTYEDLEKQSFPPQYFVGSHFEISAHIGMEPLPVSLVRAYIIRGGLLLTLYLHHSVSDGHSMRNFVKCFADSTRGKRVDTVFTQYMRKAWPYQEITSSFLTLLPSCPEFTALNDLRGPWQTRTSDAGPPLDSISRLGKIFVFDKERVDKLQRLLGLHLKSSLVVSSYNCIAALAFAHIVKSRIQTEEAKFYPEDPTQAVLWNTIGWRTRISERLPEDYFGNAVLLNTTKVTMNQIIDACDDVAALASLVRSIRESIDEVDEAFVGKRLSLFSKIDDPRILGFDLDPRVPMNLIFNSWRYFGADIDWNIPGVSVSKPVSVRKAQGSWNLGTAILLPGQPASGTQELFVSLSQGTMDSLCMDKEWLRWVSRVID